MKGITIIVVILALTISPFMGTNVFDVAEEVGDFRFSIWNRLAVATALIMIVIHFTYRDKNPYTDPIEKMHADIITKLDHISSEDSSIEAITSEEVRRSLRRVRASYETNLKHLKGHQ